jgi:hypothetical protein
MPLAADSRAVVVRMQLAVHLARFPIPKEKLEKQNNEW